MSIISRKRRPLVRQAGSFRDDRLFIVACDDTYAPKQYFDCFQLPRVKVHVVETTDGTSAARHVLERLFDYEHEDDDELWMVLDVDHNAEPNHRETFLQVIADAKRRGVQVAVSRPCFELWLLLHKVSISDIEGLLTAREVESFLREKLGSYNKTRLNSSDFPLDCVGTACRQAAALDKSTGGGDLPQSNTSRVYLLWQAIISKALATQLPPELRNLFDE